MRVVCVNCSGYKEMSRRGGSKVNYGEVQAVLNTVFSVIIEKSNLLPEDVGIVTPYSSQKQVIKSEFVKKWI